MIPKIIHYCWFGRGQMPELALTCIESWKKYLPDYELMLWNEDTFDLNSSMYTREAYESRKYAFVTDYVRLYVLEKYGGIYMDTDVEVIRSLNPFLHLPAFSGFEDDNLIPTGIMASKKGGHWAAEQLAYYTGRHFVLADGSYDTTTNVQIISRNMQSGGFVLENSLQNYKDIITMFPKDYFSPKSNVTGKITLTENTYTIHHFAGSWHTPWERFKMRLKPVLAKLHLYKIVRKVVKKKNML